MGSDIFSNILYDYTERKAQAHESFLDKMSI